MEKGSQGDMSKETRKPLVVTADNKSALGQLKSASQIRAENSPKKPLTWVPESLKDRVGPSHIPAVNPDELTDAQKKHLESFGSELDQGRPKLRYDGKGAASVDLNKLSGSLDWTEQDNEAKAKNVQFVQGGVEMEDEVSELLEKSYQIEKKIGDFVPQEQAKEDIRIRKLTLDKLEDQGMSRSEAIEYVERYINLREKDDGLVDRLEDYNQGLIKKGEDPNTHFLRSYTRVGDKISDYEIHGEEEFPVDVFDKKLSNKRVVKLDQESVREKVGRGKESTERVMATEIGRLQERLDKWRKANDIVGSYPPPLIQYDKEHQALRENARKRRDKEVKKIANQLGLSKEETLAYLREYDQTYKENQQQQVVEVASENVGVERPVEHEQTGELNLSQLAGSDEDNEKKPVEASEGLIDLSNLGREETVQEEPLIDLSNLTNETEGGAGEIEAEEIDSLPDLNSVVNSGGNVDTGSGVGNNTAATENDNLFNNFGGARNEIGQGGQDGGEFNPNLEGRRRESLGERIRNGWDRLRNWFGERRASRETRQTVERTTNRIVTTFKNAVEGLRESVAGLFTRRTERVNRDMDGLITEGQLLNALASGKSGITTEMIDRYQTWMGGIDRRRLLLDKDIQAAVRDFEANNMAAGKLAEENRKKATEEDFSI